MLGRFCFDPCSLIQGGSVVRVVVLLASLLLLATSVQAQAPSQVPFQGLLLDAGGTPVNDSVDLEFELFDALVAGTSLWSESHLGVIVVDGVYSVNLGSTTPMTHSVLAGGSAFLEITVGGEVLVPRQQLLSVPYALTAEKALVAETADSVGTAPALFVEQLFGSFSFDGEEPANDHPDEGTGDVDGDGIPNFIDPDNDNDGLSDGAELVTGNSINILSPSIVDVSPSVALITRPTTLVVTGTNLDTLSTVTFAGAAAAPAQVTATSFEIDVLSAGPAGSANIVATIANGESSTSPPVAIEPIRPSISSVSPQTIASYSSTTLVVTGEELETVTSIAFGAETPVPTLVTPTGFQIEVLAETLSSSESVVVTIANGQSVASAPVLIQSVAPTISNVAPSLIHVLEAAELTITGSGFYAGTMVQLGAQLLAPSAVSSTSMTVVVVPEIAGSFSLEVIHPNSLIATVPLVVVPISKFVFVSAATTDGNLGGVAGGDALCQSEANAAGLSGTYRAWLSDSTSSPATTFNPFTVGPYVSPIGEEIAADWADLTDGSLQAPIGRTAAGVSVSGFVWTGTLSDGTASGESCDDWSSTSGDGSGGAATQTSSNWTEFVSGLSCMGELRIYCFEQ